MHGIPSSSVLQDSPGRALPHIQQIRAVCVESIAAARLGGGWSGRIRDHLWWNVKVADEVYHQQYLEARQTNSGSFLE
jgi:hypothetical protein